MSRIASRSMKQESAASAELAAAYPRFREGLLAFLKSRLGEPATAEDLLQDVFLKALAALDRGARPDNLPAWLRTIAANTLSDHYRRGRPTQALPTDLTDTGPTRSQAEREMAECLQPFIDGLPAIYREVMRAIVIEGKTGAQLSRELGLSSSAIKSRSARGRSMLREAIIDCCYVEAGASGEIEEYRRR